MKIVFEIKDRIHNGGEGKNGLTNTDIDNLLDNMQVCICEDIIEILIK